MPINVPSRSVTQPASSSPLSSLPPSELFDTMPPIEENIENDTDEEESDVGIETDAGMEDTGVYNQSRDRKCYYVRRKLQTVVDALKRVGWKLDNFLHAWVQNTSYGRDLTLSHRLYATPSSRRKAL
jgi:hypothetical protein